MNFNRVKYELAIRFKTLYNNFDMPHFNIVETPTLYILQSGNNSEYIFKLDLIFSEQEGCRAIRRAVERTIAYWSKSHHLLRDDMDMVMLNEWITSYNKYASPFNPLSQVSPRAALKVGSGV